jgi:hypothetical protein
MAARASSLSGAALGADTWENPATTVMKERTMLTSQTLFIAFSSMISESLQSVSMAP